MIGIEVVEGIAVLTMEHGRVQALDVELVEALSAALDEVAAGSARAAIVTGKGSSFSAGVDLIRILEGDVAQTRRFLGALDAMLRKLFFFPRPVIAAMNGHAIAGGLIVGSACDHRILARGLGRLGVPELLVGVPFPAVALEILRFATPAQHLQELVYRGRRYSAEEALARGLVDELVDPERLRSHAFDLARELGALPAAAFALTKRQLRLSAFDHLDRHGRAVDAEVIEQWTRPETREHIRGYLERTIGR